MDMVDPQSFHIDESDSDVDDHNGDNDTMHHQLYIESILEDGLPDEEGNVRYALLSLFYK
jgi:hypothetical protein